MTGPNESGGGGMTGATGDLTPDDSDAAFIPAEQRKISSPEAEKALADDPQRVAGGAPPDESDGDEISDHDERF